MGVIFKQNMEHIKLTNIKNWDNTTIAILIISGLVIIFSFLSPLIFTLPASSDSFDFTKTGPIGDTIGGILNPFIALAGVLLTFLAFYMQIKANQIQITQFNEGLEKEKQTRILNEKTDCFNKLSLLKVDLETIINDIKSKSDNLKSYYEKEKATPFESNILLRTPSKNYARILEIDRLSIYKGFSLFLNHRERWIKDFSNLYNILDFLPEAFQSIYQKYDSHINDLFSKKMQVRQTSIKLMDELSKLINDYKAENTEDDYLTFPASKLANETIFKYYEIIGESFDENNNPVRETDFEKMDQEVLKPFIEKALELRKTPTYDRRLEPIVEVIGGIRKQLFLIKQRALEFSTTVESQYNNLVVDGEDKSYLTVISEIHNILETELSKVDLRQ